jgi:P-type Ca2+ transporter type 2C
MFGLEDPLRDDIKESIEIVKKAGLTVIMCTGDNLDTAKAISVKAGIIDSNEKIKKFTCMTGKEFREEVG